MNLSIIYAVVNVSECICTTSEYDKTYKDDALHGVRQLIKTMIVRLIPEHHLNPEGPSHVIFAYICISVEKMLADLTGGTHATTTIQLRQSEPKRNDSFNPFEPTDDTCGCESASF